MTFTSTRKLIGFAAAVIATVFCVIGVIFMKNDFCEVLGSIGIFLSIFSYIIGGGIKDAVKSAMKIGKWGWLVMPFPIDIATGLASIVVALFAFLCLPILFVGKGAFAAREYDM